MFETRCCHFKHRRNQITLGAVLLNEIYVRMARIIRYDLVERFAAVYDA